MITFGQKFPVPDLAHALRRSFFVRDNTNEVTLMDLVRILHALNPRALDNVPMTYRGVFLAVWGELKKLFPIYAWTELEMLASYRDWETDRKSTRLNSSHSAKSRMPSSA